MNNETSDKEPVTPELWDRMRKVFNLTQSSNEHEAALAMEMLKRMTDKYDVTIEQIVGRDEKAQISAEVYSTGMKNRQSWMHPMLRIIADYTDTKALYDFEWSKENNRYEFRYKFYGFERDRKIAVYMAEYLHHIILEMAERAWNARALFYIDDGEEEQKPRNWKLNYRMGFVDGVGEQLKQLRQHEKPTQTGTALVVMKQQTIQTWVKENLKIKKNYGGYNFSGNNNAYSTGRSAGKKHQINKAMEHGSYEAKKIR